jgi:hypothetical protein
MAHLLSALPEPEELYLSLEHPERNPTGMFEYKANDIEINLGTELVDAIVIFKPIFDARDKKKIKAVLSPDGTHITVTEPSVPTYLVDHVSQIHQMDRSDMCIPSKRAHQVIATDIKSKEARQTKKSLYFFPAGMRCKTNHFSNTVSKLKNNFRLMDVVLMKDAAGKEVKQLVSFIFWKVTINQESRHLKRQNSDDSEDLADTFKRMSAMNTGN